VSFRTTNMKFMDEGSADLNSAGGSKKLHT
jgi:hypothetical protein